LLHLLESLLFKHKCLWWWWWWRGRSV